jgi:hypothetical protein
MLILVLTAHKQSSVHNILLCEALQLLWWCSWGTKFAVTQRSITGSPVCCDTTLHHWVTSLLRHNAPSLGHQFAVTQRSITESPVPSIPNEQRHHLQQSKGLEALDPYSRDDPQHFASLHHYSVPFKHTYAFIPFSVLFLNEHSRWCFSPHRTKASDLSECNMAPELTTTVCLLHTDRVLTALSCLKCPLPLSKS